MKLIGRTGQVSGHDVAIRDLLRIGAAADNDFRVAVAGVSRHHARIVRDGDAYWLEDAGSTNGTFLNGLRVARERLRHLDVITLGRDVDLITVATDRADTAPPVRAVEDAWLEPMEAQEGNARVDIALGELTIGRLGPSNVLLDSPVVSKLHARITRSADQVIVQDLGSANGTFVNGRRIAEVTMLDDGDALAIGGSRHFRVHIAGDKRRSQPQEVIAESPVVFDQEWKTRLVWSADELAQLEAERRRILDAARKEPSLSASPAAPVRPAAAPAAPKPPLAPAAAKPPVAPAAARPPAPAKPPVADAAPRPPIAPAPAKPAAAPTAQPPAAPVAPKPPAAPAAQSPPVAPAPAAPVAARPPVDPAAPKPPVPPAAVRPPAAPAAAAPPAPPLAAKPAAAPGPQEPPAPAAPKVPPPAVTAKPAAPPAAAAPAAADAPKPPAADIPKPAPPAPAPAASPRIGSGPTIVGNAEVTRLMAAPPRAIRAAKFSGPQGPHVLEKGRHNVGRSDQAAVPILNPQVSRSHAVVSVTPTEVRVEDAGGANGTFVNGARVTREGTVLKDGDRVAFGPVEFIVELMS